jgi:hypothetical protein
MKLFLLHKYLLQALLDSVLPLAESYELMPRACAHADDDMSSFFTQHHYRLFQ